jgi:hypothetical protein
MFMDAAQTGAPFFATRQRTDVYVSLSVARTSFRRVSIPADTN